MFIYLHTTGGFYMQIQLSEHFTYKKLLRFVLPSIVMMIFTSIYGVVDGLFVSNYVGKTAFAAVNLIMPFLMAISALGFMMGTMTNTLILAFTGGSINTLVFIFAYNYEYQQVINMYSVGIEIMQGLSSSLGVIMAVPVTSWIAAFLYSKNQK